MQPRKHFLVAAFALLAWSCAEEPNDAESPADAPARPNQDAVPGGLFHDFFQDGKWDAAGHPQGAEVFEGADGCAPEVGEVGTLGIAASAGGEAAGILCQGNTRALGDGTFTLNVRAMLMSGAPSQAEDAIFEIVVFDDAGAELATRRVTGTDFADGETEQDLAVRFRHRGDTAATFEVRWLGTADMRLSYVEVFRSTSRLVVTPASRVLDYSIESQFEIEMQDPPDGVSFAVSCDGVDVTPALTELLDSGEAEWTDTDFRAVVRAPSERLFADCASPSRVTVQAMVSGFARKTARVTYLAEPLPCEFSTDADVRVLLTGFEPFPADSDRDNSSKEAVDAYVAGPLPAGVSVMRAVLPVEYDAAPALLEDLIERCDPDVVVGFGQGRSRVDVETTAYNRKDTASVAGGVPDNRGVIYGGDPIVEGAEPERTTALPVETIVERLETSGIVAGPSDDPGRYVCNNLFYTIMGSVSADSGRTGGFVHLPRIPSVGDEDREMLRTTVSTVVDAALATLGDPGQE